MLKKKFSMILNFIENITLLIKASLLKIFRELEVEKILLS